jgi:hypothetical protein
MRGRYPLAVGLGRFCRRSEEVPYVDGEASDLDTSLKMLPITGSLTATVSLVIVKRLFSERSAKLFR